MCLYVQQETENVMLLSSPINISNCCLCRFSFNIGIGWFTVEYLKSTIYTYTPKFVFILVLFAVCCVAIDRDSTKLLCIVIDVDCSIALSLERAMFSFVLAFFFVHLSWYSREVHCCDLPVYKTMDCNGWGWFLDQENVIWEI